MEAGDFDAIVSAVRSFVEREVIPREDEIEATDAVPEFLSEEAAKTGLFGYALPEEHGGLGFTMEEEVRLCFEVGRTAPAFRSLFGTNNGIAGQTIASYGTEEQKQRYLPALASGEAVGCFALTEAEAGHRLRRLRPHRFRAGRGRNHQGDLRLPRRRRHAGPLARAARREDGPAGSLDLGGLLRRRPGAGEGADRRRRGSGFRAAMKSLAKGRLTIAALCVGMAERIVAEATAFALDTRQGGTAIGEFQLVQELLAESETEARAGRALVLETSRVYDAGTDTRQGPAVAKLFASQMVNRVADRGVQVLGGMGYMRGVAVERFYRDARLYRIYEGTDEIQKLVIARQMLAAAKARVAV